MPVAIRCPNSNDADQISDVLIRSITDLCTADHNQDPDILADWIANKSPQDVAEWINGPFHLRVAESTDGKIAAVGMFTQTGDVQLLYVAPEYQSQGFSRALLSHIEQDLLTMGVATAHLVSTQTAHLFYLSQGWKSSAVPVACHQTDGYPMQKELCSA